MIVASTKYSCPNPEDLRAEDLMNDMETLIERAACSKADIVLLPAFIGCLYEMSGNGFSLLSELYRAPGRRFIEKMTKLSEEYKTVICPGSFWEKEDGRVYHSSVLLRDGRVILKQRQLYLARWERKTGIERGRETELICIDGWKTGIMLPTDIFYPQVSRDLALKGAELVLCPGAFTGESGGARHLSGIWPQTQQNLFFAAESGFTGRLGELPLWGSSNIYAPLGMTESEDGFLVRGGGDAVITGVLDREARRRAIAGFDVLKQMNTGLYRSMSMFDGDRP